MTQPKILTLDIETKPALAYVWGMFDQNIGLDQLVGAGGILCVAAKFMHSPEVHFFSEWEDGQQGMLEGIHALMNEADAVVTYNGDRFDIPKLRGQFLIAGLAPPAPVTSIDIYKAVKKLGYQSNKLAFIGPYLQVGKKIKNEGFSLWTAVIDGDKNAQRKMKRYCIGDVKLTERVYKMIRPYIHNHPHLGISGSKACGACGSYKMQSRGFRRTRAFRIQRLHCQSCGSWQDGSKHKV